MPPSSNSRYLFSLGIKDAQWRLFLTAPEPYTYRAFRDNRFHEVKAGDTLESIAERSFPNIPNSAQLFWIIADFQPQRICDPTLVLTTGRTLVIPSENTVLTRVFDPNRAQGEPR